MSQYDDDCCDEESESSDSWVDESPSLHNNIYVYTKSLGTQTDPDIFYINGKPGRAVPPFRIMVAKKRIRTSSEQAEQGENDQSQNTPQLQELQEQEQQVEEEQPMPQDPPEVAMLAAYKPGRMPRQNLQSQRTQTELRLIFRTLPPKNEGEAAANNE